jgi:hypothetical protein
VKGRGRVIDLSPSQPARCVAVSQVPRHSRIRCYLQLANLAGDWETANEYHRRATSLVSASRSHEVKGQTTAEIDAALDKLEASVEKMRKVLEEEGKSLCGKPE